MIYIYRYYTHPYVNILLYLYYIDRYYCAYAKCIHTHYICHMYYIYVVYLYIVYEMRIVYIIEYTYIHI